MSDFDPGLAIHPTSRPLGFTFGHDVFAPSPELRRLDAIRKSLRDPNCSGPEIVYAICMDVGQNRDREDLLARHLLYGVVAYAAGRLGNEPVRSQGHVHKKSPRNGWSTPEVYEIWQGRAIILMQESDGDDPGRCFAVEAGTGEVVIVPPGWAHATISADPHTPLVFGAWCDRAYGFDYTGVRAHAGLAWFPLLTAGGTIEWRHNPQYQERELIHKVPEIYREFDLERGKPIYTQYQHNRTHFDFVPDPERVSQLWTDFVP